MLPSKKVTGATVNNIIIINVRIVMFVVNSTDMLIVV